MTTISRWVRLVMIRHPSPRLFSTSGSLVCGLGVVVVAPSPMVVVTVDPRMPYDALGSAVTPPPATLIGSFGIA